jgi:tight adherence protein B
VTGLFAVLLAGVGGALTAPALVASAHELLSRSAGALSSPLARIRRSLEDVVAPLRRAGAEGIDPTRRQRRKLEAAFALGALPIGWATADPLIALALAGLAAWLASRSAGWRRERYLRRLDRGTAPAALAIADALSSGHSTRAGLAIAAGALEGPMGVELRRVAADLRVGMPTEAALERLRARVASRRVDLIVAAIRLQRRSGGNLAALLRDIAGAIEENSRLEGEASAASSQARFTSTIVLAMPVCLLGLGELADPGMVGRVGGSPLGIWLLGVALVFWLAGAALVRRLGRISM